MVWAMGQDASAPDRYAVLHLPQLGPTPGRAGPDAPIRWALGQLAGAISHLPRPVAATVSSWAVARGRRARTRASRRASARPTPIARPAGGGRLLFAGEHTQSARLAYADGALTSGIREAKRLLGTPAVRITADHA